jgi:hypothetical protein
VNELKRTRESLHAVAEWLLAGPQLIASDTVRLRVCPGGFATTAAPAVSVLDAQLHVSGMSISIDGHTVASLGRALNIAPASPAPAYSPSNPQGPHVELRVDSEAYALISRCYEWGNQALQAFCPQQTPVLWPEHFDVGVSWDEVNFGVSPGDDFHPEPYAYVGPWTRRSGEFWNATFGAFRPMSDLASPDHIFQFFAQGRRHAQEASV